MTDIPLVLSSDSTSLDWANPAVLAQVVPDSQDIQTYALMLLTTDRVAPAIHYGLQPIQRRGSWHDTYVGQFGCLFWMGLEANLWGNGSKLAQIERWAEQALQTMFDENMILQQAEVSAEFLDQESVQVDVTLLATDGTQRKIQYVVGI